MRRLGTVITVLALAASTVASPAHADTWQSEPASPVGFVDTPRIAIDGSAHLHIAYRNQDSAAPGIYYATNGTGSWVSERVTSSPDDYVDWIGTLDGGPYIVYERTGPTYQTATYQAFLVQGHWSSSVLFADGSHATFVVDTAGHLRGAVLTTRGLEYVTNASGSWTHTVVTSDAGQQALGLDPAGNPYIAYRATSGWKLAHLASGKWLYQNLPGNTAPCAIPGAFALSIPAALVVDSQGYVDVATLSGNTSVPNSNGVCFMTNRSGTFTRTLLPGLDERYTVWLGIVVDRTNTPHVIADAHGQVDERTWAGSWSVAAVANVAGPLQRASAASSVLMDGTNSIHLATPSAEPIVNTGTIVHLWRSVASDEPPFSDIVFNAFWDDIIWLYNSGITKGCAPNYFCPDDNVTRGQMAAFLVRALSLPSTTTDYFTDDNGTTFEHDINALAASGITKGCSPTSFCPDANVTRGQMAAFLVRALSLPSTTTDYFTDDNGTTFEHDINALAASGITKGCSPTSFCPDANVTRGQMAAFLHRALG